eukprot:gnl/TRDRNA2_/TRDRNA2_30515_c0_seq1.p2 gnl/TRDRNA2_/TRDRNA2_30515_c0~~gnl/TRDRNA2_/TRDRNA2_30515_c0_seq1.p2  ORF type:complete len:153 (-),score=19.58 gnl/TRDRNA2_/TRDRNA2_30515_c0_seq1:206-664(-)
MPPSIVALLPSEAPTVQRMRLLDVHLGEAGQVSMTFSKLIEARTGHSPGGSGATAKAKNKRLSLYEQLRKHQLLARHVDQRAIYEGFASADDGPKVLFKKHGIADPDKAEGEHALEEEKRIVAGVALLHVLVCRLGNIAQKGDLHSTHTQDD